MAVSIHNRLISAQECTPAKPREFTLGDLCAPTANDDAEQRIARPPADGVFCRSWLGGACRDHPVAQ